VEAFAPRRQFGLQPVEGLPAELCFCRVVERGLILALSGSGQDCGASGFVAVLRPTVVAELWVACQRLGPEARGGGELLPAVGDLGDLEAYGVIGGFFLTLNNGRISLRQGQEIVNPNAPLHAGVIGDQREEGLAIRAEVVDGMALPPVRQK